ncbi:peptidyl-tRNA hydrolase [Nitrosospira multiformis ATCC 25196]|uniref:Peptidyl-tRNA hydrolase n=2 Tax=Nitrosospira multiformis (strain ATCC 25196 / NCIMB 11849 / C 71) TaxID=323848 RepID=PTH_NITMU|nr:aminoacyl-tRNA hydrolase [Nitrosospira multiformis]Q2YBH2.1 RecName: Full=Peptidyl-tRNA hydrolase; Short=PTH [Nitrosospira multiformis ATCC 25196]ABB73899.1 peptidyl-tRNA hydrolase [Nitrosospira multiformis ATCC 25196]SEF97618.1 peptidyl-tRNA hydrolase [Nitrosospira multiformis ATCC 25196]
MKLIVGLGNPGREYAATRHNAGAWWVVRLADQLGVTLKADGKFHGLCARIGQGESESWLLNPQTYMNASGRAVAALCRFYRIQPEQMLVVHDELDLPPGVSRLKLDGGLGGHNGLKDIVAHLGTREFWRLRIGIGHPGEKHAVVNYVLQPPRKEEAALIDTAINDSLEVWPLIAEGNYQAAMMRLHTQKQS